MLLYLGLFNLSATAFSGLEYSTGVSWVFLPAGMRLLCTLLFAEEGAVGLFLAAIVIALSDTSQMDLATGIGAAGISALAPYLSYRLALAYGLPASLRTLTPGWLSVLVFAYAGMSALMHQLWFVYRGISDNLVAGFGAMFIGDLVGTLIVLYSMKAVLAVGRKLAILR